MAERYERPDWVRRLNAMGPASGGAERMVPLAANDLIDHARRSTGLTNGGDFGDGDWEGRLISSWPQSTRATSTSSGG